MTGRLLRRAAWAPSVHEAWAVAAAWAVVLFTLSSIPGDRYPKVDVRFADKYVHFLVYMPLGFALARAFAASRWPAGPGRFAPVAWIVAATVATSLYGATDEWHQILVPMRSCDANDWIVDTAAGFSGAVGFVAVRGLVAAASKSPPRPIDP